MKLKRTEEPTKVKANTLVKGQNRIYLVFADDLAIITTNIKGNNCIVEQTKETLGKFADKIGTKYFFERQNLM